MARRRPTETDRHEATRAFLVGLGQGTELPELAFSLEALHPRNDTFPGEAFMELAVRAMDLAGIRERGLPYEQLLTEHLPEYEFRDDRARKIKFAVLATSAARGGIDPDLLDEIVWWRTDDFWFYAFAAAAALVRASAARAGLPIAGFIETLAGRLGIDLAVPAQ
jgi:hypothetical protein